MNYVTYTRTVKREDIGGRSSVKINKTTRRGASASCTPSSPCLLSHCIPTETHSRPTKYEYSYTAVMNYVRSSGEGGGRSSVKINKITCRGGELYTYYH